MKTLIHSVILFSMLTLAQVADAVSPLAQHPKAPQVNVNEALKSGMKFLQKLNLQQSYYIAKFELIEGSMTPAPTGSLRHWKITARVPKAERKAQLLIYVDMEGQSSKKVPILRSQK